MKYNNIIIFDGVCNLCNWAVNFIIKRDYKNRFKFAPVQSEFGMKVLEQNNFSSENPETILLFKDGEILTKGNAALAIAAEFRGGWKTLFLLCFLPKSFRDALYDWITRTRYQWFGVKDECMIPTDETAEKFIRF